MSGPDELRENILESNDLSKHFGGVMALSRLSIRVSRGQIQGLIGPNGSGKTTFFNVVTGIYPASSGRVLFQGRDITDLSPQAVYRAGIARTFQRSRLLLPLSVFDNIMLGNHKGLRHGLIYNVFRREQLKQEFEAHLAEARELAAVFDADLAERIFEAAGRFPMIDRRRIEICRALISRPKLLLLDEPSAGMTHDETGRLMDDLLEIRDRMKDLTIVIIEHEMSVIERITEWCVVLNFGQKISEGEYSQVAADRQVQEAYLGAT